MEMASSAAVLFDFPAHGRRSSLALEGLRSNITSTLSFFTENNLTKRDSSDNPRDVSLRAIVVHKDNDLNVVRMALHHDSLTRDILAETDHPVEAASKSDDAVSPERCCLDSVGGVSILAQNESLKDCRFIRMMAARNLPAASFHSP